MEKNVVLTSDQKYLYHSSCRKCTTMKWGRELGHIHFNPVHGRTSTIDTYSTWHYKRQGGMYSGIFCLFLN